MILKKKSILAIAIASTIFGIATTANANCNPGIYVGGNLGWGDVHEDFKVDHFNVNSSKSTGLAGSVFGGYQFNQNFAAELGYTKFHNATAKLSPVGLPGVTINGTLKTYAIDLVGKAILPLQNGFNVYGKLGAAYLHKTARASSGNVSASKSEHKILPTVGAGVAYDINRNLGADLSWTHIQKVGNSKLNNTDYVGVGLTYKFG